MSSYPMLDFIGRYGGWFAVVLAVLPLAGAILLVALGGTAWWLAAGGVTAAVAYVLARSYVELVRVMVDMLLPK